MAFWLGAFSKIQSMFTNSLSPNSLGNNPNLRQQRKILIYCHKTAGFRGYILKIYPSIFVKVNFGENLRRFTKNSSHLYKNYFQFTLDALKNYFSHLIAVGNAKIKRGCANFSLILQPTRTPDLLDAKQKTFYLIALATGKFVGQT